MKTYYCPKHGRQNGSGLSFRNVDDSGHYYHICPTCYSKYPSHDYQSDSSSPLHIIAGTPFSFFPNIYGRINVSHVEPFFVNFRHKGARTPKIA